MVLVTPWSVNHSTDAKAKTSRQSAAWHLEHTWTSLVQPAGCWRGLLLSPVACFCQFCYHHFFSIREAFPKKGGKLLYFADFSVLEQNHMMKTQTVFTFTGRVVWVLMQARQWACSIPGHSPHLRQPPSPAGALLEGSASGP